MAISREIHGVKIYDLPTVGLVCDPVAFTALTISQMYDIIVWCENGTEPKSYIYPTRPGRKDREWLTNRQIVLSHNNGLCVYCGAKADSVDHVIPLSKGGTHNIDNLVPCCMSCNRKKKAKLPEGFAQHG